MTLLDELIETTLKEVEALLAQYKKKVNLLRELVTLKEDINDDEKKKG